MTVLSSKLFTDVNQKKRREKGPLVKIQIAPGQFVKMYHADAVAAGHLPPEKGDATSLTGEKMLPPTGNKIRLPAEDKGVSAETPHPALAGAQSAGKDNFTSIPGVGLATARLLTSRGITTFAQLRTADVSFLSGAARAGVEQWRAGSAAGSAA